MLESDDRGRIRIALERGRVRRSAGDPDGARPLFDTAWQLAVAADQDGLAVDAAHMIAIVSDEAEAVAWNEQALRLAESSATRMPAAGSGRSRTTSAGPTTTPAIRRRRSCGSSARWRRRRAEADVGRERIARWSVARCLRTLGRLDEALAIQRELAAELDAAGETDGYVFEEIGECLLELGRTDEARPWLALAHLELARDPWLAEQEAARLARLRDLGRG